MRYETEALRDTCFYGRIINSFYVRMYVFMSSQNGDFPSQRCVETYCWRTSFQICNSVPDVNESTESELVFQQLNDDRFSVIATRRLTLVKSNIVPCIHKQHRLSSPVLMHKTEE